MKTLELKDIAAYLPYGLKAECGNNLFDVIITEPYLKTNLHCLELITTQHIHNTPILRPMSDLAKEITYRGDKFVPIVVLAKIVSPDFEFTSAKSEDGGYSCSSKHLLFAWSNILHGFLGIYTDTQSPIPCSDQVVLFDKLSEWMFDYRGLIPAGIAIDANTLPKNPYEK